MPVPIASLCLIRDKSKDLLKDLSIKLKLRTAGVKTRKSEDQCIFTSASLGGSPKRERSVLTWTVREEGGALGQTYFTWISQ